MRTLSLCLSVFSSLACIFGIFAFLFIHLDYRDNVFRETSNNILIDYQNEDYHRVIQSAQNIHLKFWSDYNAIQPKHGISHLSHDAQIAVADSLEKIGEEELSDQQYARILGLSIDQYNTWNMLLDKDKNLAMKDFAINNSWLKQ